MPNVCSIIPLSIQLKHHTEGMVSELLSVDNGRKYKIKRKS